MFDKPKMIIDFDEYLQLKKDADSFTSDEYVIAAKKVVAAVLQNRLDIQKVNSVLFSQGIRFSITSYGTTARDIGLTHEDIKIELIKK
jgi:hypothetical protein